MGQIKNYLQSMKTTTRKPYECGQSRRNIDREAKKLRGKTRVEPNENSNWFTRLFFS